MVDELAFSQENWARIHTVENSFGPSGKPLFQPGRVLIGEGRLMKQSRKGLQPKVFFLFNDVLVYGSIVLNGWWHKKQQIIPLGEQVICFPRALDPARQMLSWRNLLSCFVFHNSYSFKCFYNLSVKSENKSNP